MRKVYLGNLVDRAVLDSLVLLVQEVLRDASGNLEPMGHQASKDYVGCQATTEIAAEMEMRETLGMKAVKEQKELLDQLVKKVIQVIPLVVQEVQEIKVKQETLRSQDLKVIQESLELPVALATMAPKE